MHRERRAGGHASPQPPGPGPLREATMIEEGTTTTASTTTTARTRTLGLDLVTASYRASAFPQDWNQEKREHEALRYERFLRLAAKHPGVRATPTREIDEFWHLHMLHPAAYYADCMRLFGTIFDHDGGFGIGPGELPVLKGAFRHFAALWEREYGEAYVANLPAEDTGATSCWHDCSGRCWHACSS